MPISITVELKMNTPPKKIIIAPQAILIFLKKPIPKTFALLNDTTERKVNHMRSHSQCTIMKSMMPFVPNFSAPSTSPNPMVAHHSRKYGLVALSRTPAIIDEPIAGLACSAELLLIRAAPRYRRYTPPSSPIIIRVESYSNTLLAPRNSKTINGISTAPCPREIMVPESLSRPPCSMAMAVMGPGAITPESDIAAADTKNSKRSCSISNIVTFVRS
jgi:hypothetical protein